MRITSNEADLYYFLLHESNLRGWQNPFECPNGIICVTIGMSEKTLIDVRNRLQAKGLIQFDAGQRRKKSPVYTLLYCNGESKSESNTVGKQVGNTESIIPNIIYKTKTETKQKRIKELNIPFSPAFAEAWKQLLNTPKWKRKSRSTLQIALDKLGKYNEAFATELVEQATIGNWQGVIYPDTTAKYEEWLSRKTKSRKANIANHDNSKAYEQF